MVEVFINSNPVVVDAVAMKMPVAIVSTANLDLTGLVVISSYQLMAGDRVLVKNQTDPKTNGIYVASTNAWLRSQDFNSARNITVGSRFVVLQPALTPIVEYILSEALPKPIAIGQTSFTFVLATEIIVVEISVAQVIARLVVLGLFDTAAAAIPVSPSNAINAAWNRGGVTRIDGPLMAAIFAAIGYTTSGQKASFIAAAALLPY